MNLFELVATLALDSSKYEKGLEDSEDKAQTFGDKLKGALATGAKIGAAALTAAAGAATYFSKELMQGVAQTAAYGDNIDKMSQKMGISAQAYQEWDAILQHSGADISTMTMSMKSLSMAAESDSEAFQRLGISQQELQSLSKEELFSRVITELQNMEEGTEKTYLASKLLGRGAVEMGALLNTSAEDTEKMRKRVHELGGVMSDEAVKNAAAYQDSLQDLKTAMSGFKNNLMASFLPSFTMVMDGLAQLFIGDGSGADMVVKGIESIAQGIEDALPVIVEKTSMVVSNLVQLIVDHLPQFLELGFTLIGKMIDGISKNLPSIIRTIINVATKLLSTLVSKLPEFLVMGVKLIASLISGIVKSVPDVLRGIGQILKSMWNAFKNYDWKSLGKNVINGIVSGLRSMGGAIGNTLMGFAQDAWKKVKSFFGISSPSRLMRDTIGKFIPMGLAEGIEATSGTVADAMDRLSEMTVKAFDPDIPEVAVPFSMSMPNSGMYFTGGGVSDVNGSTNEQIQVTFNIYTQEKQSGVETAKEVEKVLVHWDNQRRGAFV